MTKDELSAVLLKAIGFVLVVHAIVGIVQPIIGLGFYLIQGQNFQLGFQLVSVLIGAAARVAAGLFIIAKSAAISEWLFAFGQNKVETAQPVDE